MQPTILITNGDENGGVHPPRKWADITTKHLMAMFDISEAAGEAKAREVREFEMRVRLLLERAHEGVQKHTRHGLSEGVEHRDPRSHTILHASRIAELARGTSFETAFREPNVLAHVETTLNSHFHTSMEVEHKWHAHRLAGEAHEGHMNLFGHHTHPRFAKKRSWWRK